MSEVSETTTEAAGAQLRSQGIYDDDGGFGRGRRARRLQQRQRRRRKSIDDVSKRLDMTTEAEAAQRRARCIGNDNVVSIFLAIALLTVTLSRLCIAAVLFWFFFNRFLFFVHCNKYYQY